MAGEVVDGSVGRVGGVCPGGVVPSEGAGGAATVALPSTGAGVSAAGASAAVSAATSAAASALGALSSPEQGLQNNYMAAQWKGVTVPQGMDTFDAKMQPKP